MPLNVTLFVAVTVVGVAAGGAVVVGVVDAGGVAGVAGLFGVVGVVGVCVGCVDGVGVGDGGCAAVA
eukprot:3342184-Alexandrium_andersonii.AAC.1